MVRITFALVKKKAGHHDGLIVDLNELSLHQCQIDRLENIGQICHKLKILYLQNNIIPKIENLKRMKELEYLNLALNNVQMIEGLASCEKLNKLDLTVNFVDVDALQQSMENLKHNEFLSDLYMTGNPCTKFPQYRAFVIASLPSLKQLDGQEITRTERITARQEYDRILTKLEVAATATRKEKARQAAVKEFTRANNPDNIETVGDLKIDKNEYAFTPELRTQMVREDEAAEVEKKRKDEETERNARPEDPIKAARQKLNVLEDPKDGEMPRQRNVAKVEWTSKRDEEGHVIYDIALPKYMDTSSIEVDIHPTWFQCLIKGQSLLLHLDVEVNPDQCKLQRLQYNGHLHLIMPIVNDKHTISRPALEEKEEGKETVQQKRQTVKSYSDKNNTRKFATDGQLSKVSETHVSAKLRRERFKEEQRKQQAMQDALQAAESRAAAAAGLAKSKEPEINEDDYDFDLDDVPPLE